MPTLRTIVEQARHSLSGFGQVRDATTALSSAVSASDLAIPVDEIAPASAGVVEVDLELIQVRRVDVQNSALLAPPYGRGYNGTSPALHDDGAEVTINPSFPRATLARLANEVIQEFYPNLYGVASTTVAEGVTGRYVLPANAVGVISVWQEDPRVVDGLARVNQWSFDRNSLAEGPGLLTPAQSPLRVVYATRPVPFDLDLGLEQDFATVTGLSERLAGLIALGIAAKMVPFFDVARLPSATAEARADAQAHPAGGGAQTARTLVALYQQRLDLETAALRNENPIRLHMGVN